ncbi:uncharacterized protein BJ212DRAFT_1303779 [Suillus subaureus]|uniref:Ribonuclease H1 N-terminal domain-containing protein n=1 Tax=Suillus subaureus TaxID=48587 RepID=A0A9P7J747_9AGAM|nr:uncharacterized protein BJ212DRAFT_1303779 [Suillus subaureus]KAG1806127.1 hypothetical protein BJ212DRAFT_1303779 [Suillus subaureus]
MPAVPIADGDSGNGTDVVPAAPIADGDSGIGTDVVPAVHIADGNGGNGTDSLTALLAQMNITGDQASDMTSTIHDVVQNALVAAVSIISTVLTTLASASPTPASTPVPTLTPSPVLVPAPLAVVPQVNVTYHVPAAGAMGPFYWVTHGHRIGIFSTWQQTSSHVIGMSRASFSKVLSVAEGIWLMEEAIDCSEMEVLM